MQLCLSGTDFSFTSGFLLMFSPDDTRLNVPFSLIDDDLVEPEEGFRLSLTVPAGVTRRYELGPNSDADIVIDDDECEIVL